MRGAALEAVLVRQSHSRVTAQSPSRSELLPLVEAAATIADHGRLRPWRLIELRETDRELLGAAFVAAGTLTGKAALAQAAKPLRAPLLIAIVAVRKNSLKVAKWEQDAAAAGVAHTLSLLLDEGGWGVIWRTGPLTRSQSVREMHGLATNEKLLGWLYVGGKLNAEPPARTAHVDPAEFLTALSQ
ncbi:MAG: nitroreductase family protein [Microbacteriaceae bacterium]